MEVVNYLVQFRDRCSTLKCVQSDLELFRNFIAINPEKFITSPFLFVVLVVKCNMLTFNVV